MENWVYWGQNRELGAGRGCDTSLFWTRSCVPWSWPLASARTCRSCGRALKTRGQTRGPSPCWPEACLGGCFPLKAGEAGGREVPGWQGHLVSAEGVSDQDGGAGTGAPLSPKTPGVATKDPQGQLPLLGALGQVRLPRHEKLGAREAGGRGSQLCRALRPPGCGHRCEGHGEAASRPRRWDREESSASHSG